MNFQLLLSHIILRLSIAFVLESPILRSISHHSETSAKIKRLRWNHMKHLLFQNFRVQKIPEYHILNSLFFSEKNPPASGGHYVLCQTSSYTKRISRWRLSASPYHEASWWVTTCRSADTLTRTENTEDTSRPRHLQKWQEIYIHPSRIRILWDTPCTDNNRYRGGWYTPCPILIDRKAYHSLKVH